MRIFYPDQLENIWHRSRDGKHYRLDSNEKRVKLREKLESDEKFQVEVVSDTSAEILKSVHTPEYVAALVTGEPLELAESSGLLWVPELTPYCSNSCQCVILAAQGALRSGRSGTIASGGHHAVADRGYGFNPVNEVAIAAKHLLSNNLVTKLAILDLDVHYANGTNAILRDEPRVLNIDIWNKTLPKWEPVEDTETLKQYFVETPEQFFAKLETAFTQIQAFKPEVILYHSGMDVWEGDRMGGIPGFTIEKIQEREQKVFSFAKENNVPIVLVLGGGYARHDTPEISAQSMQQLIDLHLISFNTMISI